ncbi:MAG: hypothetical protein ACREQO_05820 [Candidatus Binatia bacterium]
MAERLLALEAASPTATDANMHEAARVCETLRISLIRFAGADGFTSLLRRALAVARSDVPALQSVKVTTEGRLEGLEDVFANAGKVNTEAALALIAHLLGLLATFIGESLTVRLVREGWPDILVDTNKRRSEVV